MEPSIAYKESVAKGTHFQRTKKSWAGNDSKNYISVIQNLVNKHNAKSLLDYGCGKGHQYTVKSPPFDKRCGFESYYLYDPCVDGFDVMPPEGKTFDAIICLQVIKHIPDQDMPWLKQLFERCATKFVLIGDFDPHIRQKPSKVTNTDCENRDVQFYRDAFADWNSDAKLHFYWRGPQCELALADNAKI